ncbi:MAG: GNAT family N-acetyltransferase [Pseudomonadota bacterium]
MSTLQTERLTLRPHVMADFEDYAALFASERSRYMGGPLTRAAAWHAFSSDVAQAPLGLGQAWAILRTKDDAHTGQVVLQHPPSYPEQELGWQLYDGFEGKGYAREAAQAARDFAFGSLGWDTFVSYVDPDNAASIKVAEAIGGVLDPAAPAPDEGDLVFRHTRPEGSA